MSQEMVVAKDGTFAVDWELVSQLLRSYVVARTKLANARLKVDSEWFGPDLHQIEVDWEVVSREVARQAPTLLAEIQRSVYTRGLRTAQADLLTMVAETREARSRFDQRMAAATRRTMASIQETVAFWEGMTTATKLVRDLSGATLVALAAASGSGLAIVGAAGYDGALQGWAKYEETGNVGAAIMKMTANFHMNIIPGANGSRAVLFFKTSMGGVTDGLTSLIEGKSVSEAVTQGVIGSLTTVSGEVAGEFFDSELVRTTLRRAAVPVFAKVTHTGGGTVAQVRRLKRAGATARFAATKAVSSVPGAVLGPQSPSFTRALGQAKRPAELNPIQQLVIADNMMVQKAIMGPDACYAPTAFG